MARKSVTCAFCVGDLFDEVIAQVWRRSWAGDSRLFEQVIELPNSSGDNSRGVKSPRKETLGMLKKYGCSLRHEDKPNWPNRCVQCGKPEPGATTLVVGRNNLKGRRLWAGWAGVTVPCCPSCRTKLQGGRILRMLITILSGAIFGGLGLLLAHLLRWEDPGRGLTVFGFIVVGLICNVVWEQLHPPEFDIEVG